MRVGNMFWKWKRCYGNISTRIRCYEQHRPVSGGCSWPLNSFYGNSLFQGRKLCLFLKRQKMESSRSGAESQILITQGTTISSVLYPWKSVKTFFSRCVYYFFLFNIKRGPYSAFLCWLLSFLKLQSTHRGSFSLSVWAM